MRWLQPQRKLLCCRTPKWQCLSTLHCFLTAVDLIDILLIFYFIVKEAIDLSPLKKNNCMEKKHPRYKIPMITLVGERKAASFPVPPIWWALHLPSYKSVFLQCAAPCRKLVAVRKNHGWEDPSDYRISTHITDQSKTKRAFSESSWVWLSCKTRGCWW